MVRVVVAEANTLLREGLCSVLSGSTLEVMGAARTLTEAVDMVQQLAPDVVFVGASLASLEGYAFLDSAKRVSPKAAVIVLSAQDGSCVIDIIRYGALGYLARDISRESLLLAAESAMQGFILVEPAALRSALESLLLQTASRPTAGAPYLTLREREVLALLTQGLSNGEIAGRMMVTAGTVRTHVSRLLRKLHVTDRVQAAVWAAEHGLGPASLGVAPGNASPGGSLPRWPSLRKAA